MRPWFATVAGALLIPVILCGLLTGCSDVVPKERRKGTGPSTQEKGTTAVAEKPLTELESQGWGKITGKFVNKSAPAPGILVAMEKHQDRNVCLAPNAKPTEKQDQLWIVD